MKYEVVNIDTWERGNLFQFFIDNLRNVMSMTVDINVTYLIEYIHIHRLKFYPSMMWIISKVINAHDEFKFGGIIFRLIMQIFIRKITVL